MKRNIVNVVAPFFLVFVVGLTLALVVQTSVRAVSDVRPVTATQLGQDAAVAQSGESIKAPLADGDLWILKTSLDQGRGVAIGEQISYTILYLYQNATGDADNVQITDLFPSEVTIDEVNPPPTSQGGGTLVWALGTVTPNTFGYIHITGTVKSDVVGGTSFTNSVTIAGDITDIITTNNSSKVILDIIPEESDLIVLKIGLFEEMELGQFATAEQGVETTFNVYYFNFSKYASADTTLVDHLPASTAYVSANPTATIASGQYLTWNLGVVPANGFGQVTIQVRPDVTGSFTNGVTISNSVGDLNPANNSTVFHFDVVPLLPPRVLKPNMQGIDTDHPLIVGKNPRFEGLARAGATVTLYEGSASGCVDFADCSPTGLVSATAGLDRRWVMTPTTMTATRTYSLYLRAELGSYASRAPFGLWKPLPVRIDSTFEDAGWDMDGFTIDTGGQENGLGGLGGTTGTTPNQPFTITIQQEIWDTVPTSPTLAALHDLRLEIDEGTGEPYTITLPVTEFRRVPTTTVAAAIQPADVLGPLGRWGHQLFYVQHGFGAGATVIVWCRPVYYPDDPNEIPIVGLVWTKCNEILIDPAGYVYDINTSGAPVEWPGVPPEDALITNATVTATERIGDNGWTRWKAEDTGQVNPQVTDDSSNDGIKDPGYYAFYVPSGQYQVLASAPDCLAYRSPVLTVVDAPVFHNVGMYCTEDAQTGIDKERYVFLPIVIR